VHPAAGVERRVPARREPTPAITTTGNGRGHKWMDDDAEEF
jgi:hypothetical protein